MLPAQALSKNPNLPIDMGGFVGAISLLNHERSCANLVTNDAFKNQPYSDPKLLKFDKNDKICITGMFNKHL